MPIKYVGRTCWQEGKTVWEIVGNLKNFGVGRRIVRNLYERYPEPSYMKIVKVEVDPQVEKEGVYRRANVLVEKVFRGRKYPEVMALCKASYKPDYRLLPKEEEEAYCRFTPVEKKVSILPRTMPLPPLLRELVMRDLKQQGKPLEEPMIEVQYRQGLMNQARIASDDEKANVEVGPKLGKPASPQLYENVL